MWTVLTSVGARALGLAGTLLLTRFLDPDTYGEVSLAAVVILTATTFSNCGLSQYLVSRPDAGRAAAFHATFYFTVLGLVALAVALALGRPIGVLVNAPGIVRYLPGLAFAAVLERVGTVQDRILVRDMRFRAVGLLRSLGELVYTGASVTLAAAGSGAWWGGGNAVVLACVARSLVRLVALTAVTPRREWLEPCRITWQRTRELFAFGLPMSVATLAGFGSRRWDNLVFSHHFGQGAAGVYNLAYNLADIPATQIGETIGDVLVPSFAKLDGDARRKSALMLSLRQMMLLVAPLAFGLGAVAPALAHTFFDRRWAGIEVELVILSVLSAVRPLGWIGSSYLQVENRPRTIMILESIKTATVVLGMHLLAGWAPRSLATGEHWACVAVGLAFALNTLGYMVLFKMKDGIPLRVAARGAGAPGAGERADGAGGRRAGALAPRRGAAGGAAGAGDRGGRAGVRAVGPGAGTGDGPRVPRAAGDGGEEAGGGGVVGGRRLPLLEERRHSAREAWQHRASIEDRVALQRVAPAVRREHGDLLRLGVEHPDRLGSAGQVLPRLLLHGGRGLAVALHLDREVRRAFEPAFDAVALRPPGGAHHGHVGAAQDVRSVAQLGAWIADRHAPSGVLPRVGAQERVDIAGDLSVSPGIPRHGHPPPRAELARNLVGIEERGGIEAHCDRSVGGVAHGDTHPPKIPHPRGTLPGARHRRTHARHRYGPAAGGARARPRGGPPRTRPGAPGPSREPARDPPRSAAAGGRSPVSVRFGAIT